MAHLHRSGHRAYIAAKHEQNVQELSSAQKKQQSNLDITERDLSKFEFELRNYQSESAQNLAKQLQTNLEVGLQPAMAAFRLQQDGLNIVMHKKGRSKWAKFLLSFCSGFSPLLWALVILLSAFWESMGTARSPYNAVVIAGVLVLIISVNSLIPFLLDLNVDNILHRYDIVKNINCIVVRDGHTKRMDASKLVVGDIVLLEAEHRVPADLRIVVSDALEVDGSLLTGKYQPVRVTADPVSEHISYYDASNIAFLGSTVSQGTGRGLVIATGSRTQLAKLAQQCGEETKSNPALDREIRELVVMVATFSLPVVVFVVIYWVFYCLENHFAIRLLASYLFSIMLATVPVGLPVSIRLGMVLVSRHLTGMDVLPKSPGNMPTLGAISVALMDKTGILTQNRSHVSGVLMAQDVGKVTEWRLSEDKMLDPNGRKEEILRASLTIAALCNESNGAVEEMIDIGSKSALSYANIAGKSTDRGLLQWASEHINVQELVAGRDIKMVIPFSHQNMFSVAVVSSRSKPNEAIIMVKGAPERVLAMCSHCVLSGSVRELTSEFRLDLQRMIDAEAEQGSRVVALAQRGPGNTVDALHDMNNVNPLRGPSHLTFISAIALADPSRDGARAMVEQLREAGILVSVVTGDSVASAISVARRDGVFADSSSSIHSLNTLHGSMSPHPDDDSRSIAVTGEEVEQMSEVEWDYVLRHTEIVFARASIDHKLRIAEEFQKRGHIVSVTGDGVNDTAALHGADVGIATNGGSDVAREVAEVVLLRDDILAIPKAVREGRLLFDNLQKAMTFALVGDCWSVLIPLLLAFCLGLPNPMLIFHMVVTTCLGNVFGTLALMCEGAETGIMSRPPRNLKGEILMDLNLRFHAFVYGNLIAFGASFNYFLVMAHHHFSFPDLYDSRWKWTDEPHGPQHEEMVAWREAASVYFITVVVGQLFSLLAIRQRTPYFCTLSSRAAGANQVERTWSYTPHCFDIQWSVAIAWLCSLGVTCLYLYIPFFHVYCRTFPVSPYYWGLAVGWGVLWFMLSELGKWFRVFTH